MVYKEKYSSTPRMTCFNVTLNFGTVQLSVGCYNGGHMSQCICPRNVRH
jgi:hypothetical protein